MLNSQKHINKPTSCPGCKGYKIMIGNSRLLQSYLRFICLSLHTWFCDIWKTFFLETFIIHQILDFRCGAIYIWVLREKIWSVSSPATVEAQHCSYYWDWHCYTKSFKQQHMTCMTVSNEYTATLYLTNMTTFAFLPPLVSSPLPKKPNT